jgi:hypothetical protein
MVDFKLQLPEPTDFEPANYTRNHLIPLAAQLHKLCSEFFTPGATDEAGAVDMAPKEPHKYFEDVDTPVSAKPKSVRFSVDPNVPLFKGEKRLKICLSAVVFCQPAGTAVFRLVRRSDKAVIEDSLIQTAATEPTLVNRWIPFGNEVGRIGPYADDYIIQAKYMGTKCLPICRRFSLSVAYV